MQDLKYPIGKFHPPVNISKLDIGVAIREIERLPRQLKKEVENLSENQLDTNYRPGGWTVRQVIHHVAESHMNSYIRFKWTLTERTPTIKAYDEKAWTELEDNRSAPINMSLLLLEALHTKWVFLLKNLTPTQWEKAFVHPESGEVNRLSTTVLNYAWHGKHHLAHIKALAERNGWNA